AAVVAAAPAVAVGAVAAVQQSAPDVNLRQRCAGGQGEITALAARVVAAAARGADRAVGDQQVLARHEQQVAAAAGIERRGGRAAAEVYAAHGDHGAVRGNQREVAAAEARVAAARHAALEHDAGAADAFAVELQVNGNGACAGGQDGAHGAGRSVRELQCAARGQVEARTGRQVEGGDTERDRG